MKLRLKEMRKQKDMTQRQVAEAAGMSVSYYTEIELGRKQINANRLESLARVFGVSPQALIEGTASHPSDQIVSMLEALSPANREIVLSLVRSLASKE